MKGRLLFVVNDAGFFLSHRLPVALAARRAGLEVMVAVPPAPAEGARIRAQNLELHDFALSRRGLNPLAEAARLAALVRLYRRLRPDVVHHVTIKPVIYGSLAARVAPVRAVVNAVTGLGYVFIARDLRGRVLRAGVRALYRVALAHPRARVIFQNPDDHDAFVADGLVKPEAAVLIRGSGVDVTRFAPTPEPPGPPVVVLASRMLWDKGVAEFVEAARRLRAQGAAARFVLVGDTDAGNPACIPEASLRAWQAEGAIEWWGRHDDMPAVFARSHVVCLPSYREGLPKVLLEGAACGRPLVATDVPGCREIVRPGSTGLRVPARDASALAAALGALLADPAERARLGRQARDLVVRELSEEHVVAATLALYEQLLS